MSFVLIFTMIVAARKVWRQNMKRRVLSITLVLTMLFSSVPEVDTVFSYALDLSEEIESLDTHDCCEEHVHDHDCCEECLHDYGCCEDCDCSDTCEHNHDCCDECDCCEGCCGESKSSADSVEVNEIVNMFNASAPSQALSLGALNAPALLGSSLFASVNDTNNYQAISEFA